MMLTSGADEDQRYSGNLDCAKSIYKQSGIPGFFHGAVPNIIRGLASAGVMELYRLIQLLVDNAIKNDDTIGAANATEATFVTLVSLHEINATTVSVNGSFPRPF